MLITSDIVIKNEYWSDLAKIVVDKHGIFSNYVVLFILCCAVGVCENQSIDFPKDDRPEIKEINLPRSVLLQRVHNDNLDFLFKTYIFSSSEFDDHDKAIEIAFRDDEEKLYKKIEPLKLCANYGAKRLRESISDINNEYTTMEEILRTLKDLSLDLGLDLELWKRIDDIDDIEEQ